MCKTIEFHDFLHYLLYGIVSESSQIYKKKLKCIIVILGRPLLNNSVIVGIKHRDGIASVVDCLVEEDISMFKPQSRPSSLSLHSAPLTMLRNNNTPSTIDYTKMLECMCGRVKHDIIMQKHKMLIMIILKCWSVV